MADQESSFSNDENVSPVERLVGEDKKYKTIEDLAKAAIEKDKHIQQLEHENGELRSTSNTGNQEKPLTRQDVVDLLKTEQTQQNTETQQTTQGAPQGGVQQGGETDIATVVREVVAQDREVQTREQNLAQVETKMTEVFGTAEKKKAAVVAKAAELGVSTAFLEDAAAKSPKAFFIQMGIDSQQTPTPPLTDGGSGIIPQAGQQQQEGNTTITVGQPQTKSFYDTLRKKDKRAYFSADVQNKLMSDRQTLGPEKFYDV